MRKYNLGISYRGGKSRYVESLIEAFPSAENFYDLFAGGCSVTHAAIKTGKYKNFYINDLDFAAAEIFRDAIMQSDKIDEFVRILPTKEDFDNNKATDPYKKVLWSFSTNLRGFYKAKNYDSRFIEAMYKFCRGDTDTFELDNNIKCESTDFLERYDYLFKNLNKSNRDYSKVIARCRRVISVREDFKNIDTSNIHFSKKDYREIDILPNSVIYCDIPYLGTESYPRSNKFDYEAFYKWAEEKSKDNIVLVSEFYMPEDKWERVFSKDINLFSNNNGTHKNIDSLWRLKK